MTPPARIRVIAICLVRRGESILVFEGFDANDGGHYYRPLGGGVEPGERAAGAVARELREELGCGVRDLRQRGVIENIFTLDGVPKHEIVFVFEGELTDPSIYAREVIETCEHDGSTLRVVWRSIASFDAEHRLVPDGLIDIAARHDPVERESMCFSAKIAMWLELDDGRRVDVGQSGPDFLILRGEDVNIPTPLNATFAMSLDGRVTRDRFHFPAGIIGGRREQPYLDVSQSPDADGCAV
jgi:8-oxo-dGTP pyrophosphatase MutT (NUDIX family)